MLDKINNMMNYKAIILMIFLFVLTACEPVVMEYENREEEKEESKSGWKIVIDEWDYDVDSTLWDVYPTTR